MGENKPMPVGSSLFAILTMHRYFNLGHVVISNVYICLTCIHVPYFMKLY